MPNVTITCPDGAFSGYLAMPARPKGPAIITLQQIFGVNAEMRTYTDEFAADGYIALCPDLYWRQQPGVEISPGTPEALQQAMALNGGLDVDKAVDDLKATIAFLRSHPSCNGKVASVGYCLGGLLAFLLSTRADADANVSYFGVGIEKWISEVPRMSKPLLLHVPEKDRFVPPEAQKIIKDAVRSKADYHGYPEADHAFNRVGSRTYDAAVTTLAAQRTNAFLVRHLGS